jgi:hypothetical protein
MKITAEMNDIEVDEWGTTLSEVIKMELTSAIRAEVRSLIKEDKKRIQAETAKVVKKVLKELSSANVENIVRDTVARL